MRWDQSGSSPGPLQAGARRGGAGPVTQQQTAGGPVQGPGTALPVGSPRQATADDGGITHLPSLRLHTLNVTGLGRWEPRRIPPPSITQSGGVYRYMHGAQPAAAAAAPRRRQGHPGAGAGSRTLAPGSPDSLMSNSRRCTSSRKAFGSGASAPRWVAATAASQRPPARDGSRSAAASPPRRGSCTRPHVPHMRAAAAAAVGGRSRTSQGSANGKRLRAGTWAAHGRKLGACGQSSTQPQPHTRHWVGTAS